MDYSKCNGTTLHEHLRSVLPVGSLSVCFRGVYYEEASTEKDFRDALEDYIAECNAARTTADGYELVEDLDPRSGVNVFYIMREDGDSMAELCVFFVDEGDGVTLHRPL